MPLGRWRRVGTEDGEEDFQVVIYRKLERHHPITHRLFRADNF